MYVFVQAFTCAFVRVRFFFWFLLSTSDTAGALVGFVVLGGCCMVGCGGFGGGGWSGCRWCSSREERGEGWSGGEGVGEAGEGIRRWREEPVAFVHGHSSGFSLGFRV